MQRQGRYEEALALRRRELALWRRAFGAEHQAVAQSMAEIAVVLTQLNRLDEAERLFQAAAAMRLRVSGPDHPLLAYTLRRHAELLIKRGDFAGAEALLQRAAAILRRQLPAEHPDVRSVYEVMSDLYDAWGRPDEARRYRQAASLAAPRQSP
jgi:tetratricopeptide (TPR) repeat protein